MGSAGHGGGPWGGWRLVHERRHQPTVRRSPLPRCPQIHRVPVVDDEGRCLGLVTRSDLFWHLASQNDRVLWLESHGVDLHA